MSGFPNSWFEPQVEDWTSLWECLHDAYVLSIHHDALEGTAVVELKLGYPAANESGVTSEKASIQFRGTTHILLSLWRGWPGPRTEYCQDMTSEQWNEELKAWTKKGCVQTVKIDDFNEALSKDEAYILEARGSFGSSRCLIEFEGCFNEGESFSALIAGDSVSVELDGFESSIEDLMSKGTKAWDAFHSK